MQGFIFCKSWHNYGTFTFFNGILHIRTYVQYFRNVNLFFHIVLHSGSNSLKQMNYNAFLLMPTYSKLISKCYGEIMCHFLPGADKGGTMFCKTIQTSKLNLFRFPFLHNNQERIDKCVSNFMAYCEMTSFYNSFYVTYVSLLILAVHFFFCIVKWYVGYMCMH